MSENEIETTAPVETVGEPIISGLADASAEENQVSADTTESAGETTSPQEDAAVEQEITAEPSAETSEAPVDAPSESSGDEAAVTN